MHDWFLALTAAACGKIFFLDEATIDYRQHGGNVVGAKNVHSPAYLIQKLFQSDWKAALWDTAEQAASLLSSFGPAMTESSREICREYSRLPSCSKLQRLRAYRRFSFWKQGFPRRIGQIFWW